MDDITKYIAITSIWAVIGIICYRDPTTIIFGGILAIVATIIIMNKQ